MAPAVGLAPKITDAADKNYFGHEFEAELAEAELAEAELLRPALKGEAPRPGAQFFKPLRRVIESTNDTFKGQLDLEQHGGHTSAGYGSASCSGYWP